MELSQKFQSRAKISRGFPNKTQLSILLQLFHRFFSYILFIVVFTIDYYLMTAQSKTFPLVFTLILKYILEYVPVKILGRLTLFIRDLLRSALSADKNTRLPVIISSPCAEYDALSYRTSEVIEDAPAERANDIIFYLHGGGFAIHDNTDIILSPTLFPVLNELLGYRPPEIYSVRYTISPVKGEPHTFTRIQKEVYDAFKSIASQGKNIVAVSV